MAKWVYKRLRCTGDMDNCDKKIREFGEDGWELVSAIPIDRAGSTTAIEMYFKAPVEDENTD